MYANIEVGLQRIEELVSALRAEYQASMAAKVVTPRAQQLTHEVCERARSVLDRTARRYWELYVAPHLTNEDVDAAAVYFPISESLQSFDSILGRWRWRSVRSKHDPLYDYLLAFQPFSNPLNRWLSIVNDLAVAGKHVDLLPQTRLETVAAVVRRPGATSSIEFGPGGSISFGPGGSISFGPHGVVSRSGVSISGSVSVMGAPVDPRSQEIIPTAGATERVERWISFIISRHGVNALEFVTEVARQSRSVATEMSARFGLD